MVKKAENIIVGISIGDLNGIGSEVILKTFEDTRMLELCTPVIFANAKIVSFLRKELNIDIEKSFMIGDNETDILAGKNAGVKTILVKTNSESFSASPDIADFYTESLNSAVEMILKI